MKGEFASVRPTTSKDLIATVGATGLHLRARRVKTEAPTLLGMRGTERLELLLDGSWSNSLTAERCVAAHNARRCGRHLLVMDDAVMAVRCVAARDAWRCARVPDVGGVGRGV